MRIYAQQPPSSTARQVGNVQVTLDGRRATVEAVFTLTEFRKEIQRMYAGRYLYTVVADDGRLRLAAKRVELMNRAGAPGNLSFVL